MPQLLTFKIPNKGLLCTASTYLSFKIRVDYGTSIADNEYLYQKNCAIYASSAPTTVIQ